MLRLIAIAVAGMLPLMAGDAASAPWIRAASLPGSALPGSAMTDIRPDVHSVEVRESEVVVRSAGLSLAYLGPLQSPPQPAEGVQRFEFHIPRTPQAAANPASLPAGAAGVFLNGMPVWNQFEASSFEGRNIWHHDPLFVRPGSGHALSAGMLEGLVPDRKRHSPVIGYAFDGYPIYGPWGADGDGGLRRMRSGYRLRKISVRETLPDGKLLTPGQYGPPVNDAYPLGSFAEDYEYVKGSGELDGFNGRFVVTPEYPGGTYAYFLATTDGGQVAFPYLLATRFRGTYSEAAAPPSIHVTMGRVVKARENAPVRAGHPATFELELPDAEGTRVRHPEFVHERPIHLMIVSADRNEFAHIHPEVTSADSWRVTHTFAYGGRYRIYAEFILPGEQARTEHFDVTVQGPARPVSNAAASGPEFLTLVPPGIVRAREEVELRLRPARAADLRPWLGAWAHVAIVGEGLTSFTHAHPLTEGTSAIRESEAHSHAPSVAGPPPEEIRVPASFSRPGVYKLWAQADIAGEVRTVPFTVRVDPAAARPVISQAIPRGAIRIRIGTGGYEPARIDVPAGQPVTLAFERTNEPNCGAKVVFSTLGIERNIALGGTTLVTLPPQPAGELRFSCGMGMNRGSLIIH